MTPSRDVVCSDAITWLKNQSVVQGHSYFASLPDISEFPKYTLTEWKAWFYETALLILSKTHPLDCAVFFQSDIKHNKTEWVDKSYLIQKAAETLGCKLWFHKIMCRVPADTVTLGRPGYSHLLCFSYSESPSTYKYSFADVMSDGGKKTWPRGVGADVASKIAQFIKHNVGSHTLINPFCGEGAMLMAANDAGMNAIGIERSAKRARTALKVPRTF